MAGSEPIDLQVVRARNQRPRAGNLIALLVAVAAIGAVLTWGTTGIGTARGAPDPAQGSGACSTILAEYPNVNSTMFQEICAEPSFQSALDQWGVTNFSTGTSFGPGWADDYYQFVGVGYCTNTSWGGNDQPCSVQEYWTANLTSGEVSGPTLQEGPIICGCAEVPGRLTNPWPGLILVGGICLAVAIELLAVVRWRRRRTRGSPPSRSPPQGSR